MRFLVVIGIILGVFFLIVTFVFRVLRDIVKIITPNSIKKETKKKYDGDVIYNKDDIVVMKGDSNKSQDQ
jgi:hypothetical protein